MNWVRKMAIVGYQSGTVMIEGFRCNMCFPVKKKFYFHPIHQINRQFLCQYIGKARPIYSSQLYLGQYIGTQNILQEQVMLGEPKKFAKPHFLKFTLPIFHQYTVLAQGSIKLFRLFKEITKDMDEIQPSVDENQPRLWMKFSRVVRASECQCQSPNFPELEFVKKIYGDQAPIDIYFW